MDLVKLFNIGADKQVTINVHGTEDEPLFQANQIGELLGMTNIRKSIADFDDDDARVTTTVKGTVK